MNYAIFYFSATGITETISNHIAAILEKEGNAVKLVNMITPESRQSQFDFSEFDACFFGFPVFGGRPPTVAEDWMRTLETSSYVLFINASEFSSSFVCRIHRKALIQCRKRMFTSRRQT